ncbi:hypothetical protein CKM354_000929100 [Cercospora kikuchii]|uniref:Uncharacterized protein n=1 Tax=Cercospora kikuchii TaxID=84275 RepID=A0A9P3CMX3_9PEZI|nr:uncharacterized protein CKM354_000929100 [Cercospora kikuchii]GIZ46152.1 hypothetical protein CKM354_000929100 [Cercospora kikuchii]
MWRMFESSPTALKHCREEETFDFVSHKRPCRGRRDARGHYPSYYTTVSVFLNDGLAKVTKCCIDSGYESSGRHGNINPSVVEKMGLVPCQDYKNFILADGSVGFTTHAVDVPLTFTTQASAVTVDAVLHVNKNDVNDCSILLSTGILNALGAMHDHRSNPSIFSITSPHSGELEELIPDSSDTMSDAIWFPKNEVNYMLELVGMAAFARLGRHAFPTVAWTKIGTSREVYAIMVADELGAVLLNSEALEHIEDLLQWIAIEEWKEYFRLWRMRRGPNSQDLNRAVDKEFSPEWASYQDDLSH